MGWGNSEAASELMNGFPHPTGLKARAGWPQNRHSGPPTSCASIQPVVLAVAACIPSTSACRSPARSMVACRW